jgi:RIO kinase 1
MEFMGKDGIAFPLLKQAINSVENIEQFFQTTIEFMKRLYSDARLVHADLSEYNILVDEQCNPVFIDMGQSVLLEHPRAQEFLRRDVSNVIKFFNEHGLTASENALLREITE